MARPTKHTLDKRVMQLPPIRVTSADYLHVKTQADNAGLSLTAFIRDLALSKKVKPRQTKLEASFLVELNRIGVNLNQITHARNIGREDPATLQYALNELMALMVKIDEVL